MLYTIFNQKTYPGWGYMLEQGATTLWEQWNGHASQIHSCFASPGSWFYQGLAGIRPDESGPGFKKILIKPAVVGDLTWVKCGYDSIHGRIVSNWKRDGGKLTMDVTIPINTTATVSCPGQGRRRSHRVRQASRQSGRREVPAHGKQRRRLCGWLGNLSLPIHTPMKYTTTAISLLLTALPCTAADFFLKNGDKVVMMGDSITEQHLYSSYVEAWALTRFPAWDLKFFNVGIGGDNAGGGGQRFKRDVVGCGATAMTVNFGMNDCGGPGSNFDENRLKIKEFMTSMQKIADQAKAANIRVAWCTTTPAEVMDEGPSVLPYILNLEKFSGAVKEIAATNGNALFIDQFHPFVAAIDKARAANPKNRIGGGDVVHPGPPGQTLMAAEILKGMSFPPLVAAVEINAASRKVVQNKNCEIEGPEGRRRRQDRVPTEGQRAAVFSRWGCQEHSAVGADPGANERLPPESDRPEAGPV